MVEEMTNRMFAQTWRESREVESEADPNLGWVYLVEMTRPRNLVKIGFAKDMRNRVASLQTSSPFALRLVTAWRGYKKDERRLHKEMQAHHYRREWFRYGDEIDEFVEDVYDYQLDTIVKSPIGDLDGSALEPLEAMLDVPITGFWVWREQILREQGAG